MKKQAGTAQEAAGKRWLRCVYVVALGLVGVALLLGGLVLAVSGGSLYYLAAGCAIAISGLLVWRGDPRGARLYGAMLLVTLAWSLYEVGGNTWGLVARLVAPVALGAPLLLRTVRGAGPPRARWSKRSGWIVSCAGIGAAVLAGLVLHVMGTTRPADPLWRHEATGVLPQRPPVTPAPVTESDWPHYGNDAGGTRFSPLNKITTANVDRLEVAWEADVGPATGVGNSLQVTPIRIGDALYVCNGHNVVISLDAETGREHWRYDMTGSTPPSGKPCRGVSFHRVQGSTGMCAERIYAVSQTPELFALDAASGRRCEDFGDNGRVELLAGMGSVPPGYYYVSSAPQVVGGKVIFGGAVMDGQYWGEPSGVIRAYDAVSGRLAWAFDPGRVPGRPATAEGDVYTLATPNSWAPISADESLGLVYLPTGNATPDFQGAHRRPFDDEVSSSVIALDIATGNLRWRFQTVHHDLWDYDVPSQPTLIDLPTPSGKRRALIQPTKRGEIFVLDRATGEPIKAVKEMAVPQDGIPPGERLSPTQPFSVEMPSFRGPTLRESDMWGLTPLDQLLCRILFKRSRYEGTLTPVSLERPTILDPGYSGGINWGSVSVDVDRALMIVNWMRLPSRVELLSREEARDRGFRAFDGTRGQGSGRHPQENAPYAAQVAPFLSPTGIPCSAPPWGSLSAVDLASGRVLWSQPLGNGRDSGPWGLRSHLPVTMGVPNSGGSLTTRGGLVFIGASVDSMVRAFDSDSGKLLWQASLPGAGMATPMTFQSSGGRQFVVIAAGGRPALKTRLSTKIVAYALPR